MRQDFFTLNKSKFRAYFDPIWHFHFFYFPKCSVICHLTDVKITTVICISSWRKKEGLKSFLVFLHCYRTCCHIIMSDKATNIKLSLDISPDESRTIGVQDDIFQEYWWEISVNHNILWTFLEKMLITYWDLFINFRIPSTV